MTASELMIFFAEPEVHQTIIHGDDAPYFNNVDQLVNSHV